MNDPGIFRRRNMPHWDVEGKPVFITGCLDGSISSAGYKRIEEFRSELDQRPTPDNLSDEEWEDKKQKLLFKFVDHLLDHQSPVKHLADDRQAKIVQDAFFHFAEERYKLIAFCVMPSHHHWLFLPDEDWSLRSSGFQPESLKQPKDVSHSGFQPAQTQHDAGWKPTLRTPREIISHSIQSYTANQCNKIRGVSGRYWQVETFDHWVRDDEELGRIIRYIENNSVVAGLVGKPQDYRRSSAYLRSNFNLEFDAPLLKIHNQP